MSSICLAIVKLVWVGVCLHLKSKINRYVSQILHGYCVRSIFHVCHGSTEAPEGHKWEAVPSLSDEFDEWNASKWFKSLWNYGEPVQMRAQNSGVSEGNLWIKATLDSTSNSRWFETSRVMSRAQIKFPMYTECSIKTAHISGYNTFWMNNGDINNRDEIDICENNSKPSITSKTNWPYLMQSQYFITVNRQDERAKGNFDNRDLPEENPLRGVKWNEAYHTLGVWWKDENNVQFYLNGEAAGSVSTNRKFTRSLNIIWDLWTIDAPWSGGIAAKEDLLVDSINTLKIDWIHTYKLVSDSTTSISRSKPDKEGFGLYPNPASQKLYFSGFKVDGLAQVAIMTLDGRQVSLGPIHQEGSAHPFVEIGHLEAGLYLVKLMSDGVYTKSFVKI